MAQMSDFLENALINHVFRNTAYTQSGQCYIALYSADPTDADTGTELTGSGYARVLVDFDAPTNGVTQNTADALFAAATAEWLPITHIAVRSAITAGDLLMHKALTTPITVADTNNFRIPAGQLTVTLA